MAAYQLTTEITELCGINLPFIQAGMTQEVATPEFISAFSNSGGLGVLSTHELDEQALEAKIQAVKSLTQYPFAVEIHVSHSNSLDLVDNETQKLVTEDWLARYKRELSLDNTNTKYPPELSWESGLDIALNHGVRVVIFTQGLPDSVTMKKLKAADVTVIATATHLVEAIVAEEIGCDAVIAQGMEAGGERATFIGKVSDGLNPLTMLIPLFVDHLEIPVIASGGIGDVRGAYAMLGMGAQGMQMGTIFIPSPESGANQAYKQAVLNSLECSTTISRVFSGRPARVIINRLTRDANRIDFTLPAQKIQSKLMRPLIEVAREMQVTDIMPLYAGISAYMATEESVSEVLDDWAYALTEPYREDEDAA